MIDLIGIIYANIQNPLSNFVVPRPHIIHTKLHQNHTSSDREKTFSVKANGWQQTSDDDASPSQPISTSAPLTSGHSGVTMSSW